MVLEISECILINNNGRSYTDCMEFSLLRFMQLLVYDPKELSKELSLDNFCFYPNYLKKKFIEFINKYPKIYKCMDCINTNERQDWSIFVSDRNFFEYYRNDNAELFTNIKNILLFYINFFDLDLDLNNEQESLNIISNKFSSKNKKIKINIKEKAENHKELKMKEIINMISRPDNEYEKLINKKFIVVERKTIIDIYINEHIYQWNLYEVFFSDKLFKNNFITGHSIIKKI